MKIKTLFVVNMLLFGILVTAVSISLLITMRQVERLTEQEETARFIERTARDLSYLSNDYLLHREEQQRNRWVLKFNELANHLNDLHFDNPDQQALVDQIRLDHERLQTVYTSVVYTLEETVHSKDPSEEMAFLQVSWSRMEIQNQGMIFSASLLANDLRAQVDQLKHTNTILTFVLVALVGAYIATNYLVTYRRTLRALAKLQAGTKIIGSGDLNHRFQDEQADEIGDLSRAFNQMTTDLQEITASKADLVREIREREQMGEALRQSEARLRRLVEANIIGVVTRDLHGQVKDANDAFLNIVGFTREELQGGLLNTASFQSGVSLPAGEVQTGQDLVRPDSLQPVEQEYLRKDGRRVPVLVGETRLEGSPPEYIGFVLDLSELKQTQAALADYIAKLNLSNQELEQFAFIASHDLQEPLRKILTFGDMLKRNLGDRLDEEQKQYLERMQNAATRMQKMINDLLELSRVGSHGVKPEQIELSALVAEVLSDLEPRIKTSRGQVQVDPLPDLEADPLQVRQLMQNLIGNAIKYHKPEVPPLVRVWCQTERRSSENALMRTIYIEDNGIGFSEEYLEHIFQPFARLHGRGEFEGTGIGLAICKKIVDRHHGTITARSQPGQGSTFIISLPVLHQA